MRPTWSLLFRDSNNSFNETYAKERMDVDEVKIGIRNGGLLEPIVSKLIVNAIRKKLGCEVGIEINGLTVAMENGKTTVGVDLDATIENQEFIKLLKTAGLE